MPTSLVLGFGQNLLDRAGAEREADILAGAPESGTRFVAVAGEVAILSAGPEGATALLSPDRIAGEDIRERVFLGRLDGAPVIAAGLDPARAEALREDPAFLVLDLRTIATQGSVPVGEIGMLAQAKSLLLWHSRHRFCANCGAPTAPGQAGLRRDCAACGAQHFPRTDPVTIMLVARGDHCLLGRQARFVAGSYSCLAGFVSPGETIEDAVRREVLEEACIAVGRVRYHLSQPWPFPSSLMIGCLGEALGDDITIDRDELEDCRWFARDEVASMLDRRHPDGLITPPPMAIAHHLMRAWVDGATP
ncbi:NAD(+) diphosphatase [uncultured Enterovirga sp.]|uniref:NAD(+) diphosphatase n=1 Tax=uncultured Enterovirga sp. TaxID=2026352 RepID=UPI0035CAD221